MEQKIAAGGALKQLVVAVVLFAAFIGVATWLEPFGQEYQVKTAVRTACSALIRAHKTEISSPQLEAFESKLRQSGARVKREAWDITVEHDKGREVYVCDGRVNYRSTTEWTLLGDIFQLSPLELRHRVRVVVEVKDRW